MTRRNLWALLTGFIFTSGKNNKVKANSSNIKYIQSIRNKCNLGKAHKGEFNTSRLRSDIIKGLLIDEAKERYGVNKDGDLNDANIEEKSQKKRDWLYAYEQSKNNKYEFCYVKIMALGRLKSIVNGHIKDTIVQ